MSEMAKAICVSRAHLLPILTLLSPDTLASLHFPVSQHPCHSHTILPAPTQSLSPLHHPELGGALPYPSPTVALTGGGCLCPGLPHICVVFGA